MLKSFLFIPRSMKLQLNEHCNLACSYCYVGEMNGPKIEKEMSYGVIDKLLANLNNSINQRSIVITFTAGEPLLSWEKLQYIIKNTEKENIVFQIITNGTLITDAICEFLKSEPRVKMKISLDGLEDLHNKNRSGSFTAAIRGILLLQNHGIPVSIPSTLTEESLENIEAHHQLLSAISDDVRYNFEFGTNWRKSDILKKKERYLLEHKLGLAESAITPWICIDYEGNYYDFLTDLPEKRAKRLMLGNIFDGLNLEKWYEYVQYFYAPCPIDKECICNKEYCITKMFASVLRLQDDRFCIPAKIILKSYQAEFGGKKRV